MTPQQFQRLDELFVQAGRLAPDHRTRFARQACVDDPILLGRLLDMLIHDDRSQDFMQTPAMGNVAQMIEVLRDQEITARHPERIGRYQILSLLGEGGMGVVYLAQQENPERTVALKAIRSGFITPSLLRRFEMEIRALGQLQHPGICQIFEAGSFDTGMGGQPFFVMEYIRGKPLLEHARARNLGTRARLELLSQICRAVHHAHERGIIHRDLKPGNILIDQASERPKILDFGISRAIESDLQLTTQRTDIGQLIGTIAYMSPEQVTGRSTALDARSDVYALGVIGYELLADRTPFDLSHRTIPEAARIIADEDHTPLSALNKAFRGDLETIISKALEKDRTRRYHSAAALAEDIDRYLRDEPIVARPVTTMYQLRKFARRNRAMVAGAVAVMVVLAAGVVVSTSLWLQTLSERNLKEQQRKIADAKTIEAQTERAEAEWQSYVANIAAAESSIRSLDLVGARRRLDQCPQDLRGWEWRHLHARLDQSRMTLRGHDDHVNDVAWSPDGKLLASISNDRTVRLWDAETGRNIKVLRGHTQLARKIAFSPDGRTLASVAWDNTMRLWSVSDGEELATCTGLSERPQYIAWSPDGRWIAVGCRDGSTSVCDMHQPDLNNLQESAHGEMRTPFFTLRDGPAQEAVHAGAIPAFSPDSQRLAVLLTTGRVQVWDMASRTIVTRHSFVGEDAGGVCFDPGGTTLAVSLGNHQIVQWNIQTSTTAHLVEYPGVGGTLQYSRDGTRLLSSSWNPIGIMWDVADGTRIGLLLGHSSAVVAARFSPDERQIATCSSDGTIKLWDAATNDVPTLRGHHAEVYSVKFSPSGAMLASGSSQHYEGQRQPASIRIWDVHADHLQRVLAEFDQQVYCVAFSPDGTTLAAGLQEGAIVRYDVVAGTETARIQGLNGGVFSIAFTADGRRLVAGSTDHKNNRDLLIVDALEWELIERIDDGSAYSRRVALSPDDRLVAVGSDNGHIRLMELSTKRLAGEFAGHSEMIQSLSFSPDGTLLASASLDDSIRLWDVATLREVAVLLGHTGDVNCIAFTPDGRRLVSGSHDRTVRLWDVAARREVAALHGHTYAVFDLAVSPDGSTIASGSADSTVRLWQALPP